MKRRTLMAGAAILTAAGAVNSVIGGEASEMDKGYVSVNGLKMYYERHGNGGTPLVLLHGAFSALGTSFGTMLPALAQNREVIAFELQGHGHTADIDRPLELTSLSDDVGKAIDQIRL